MKKVTALKWYPPGGNHLDCISFHSSIKKANDFIESVRKREDESSAKIRIHYPQRLPRAVVIEGQTHFPEDIYDTLVRFEEINGTDQAFLISDAVDLDGDIFRLFKKEIMKFISSDEELDRFYSEKQGVFKNGLGHKVFVKDGVLNIELGGKEVNGVSIKWGSE